MDLDLALEIGLFYWARFAGLAALLVLAIFLARRRWRAGAPGDQARRIIFPWLAVIFGFAIYLGLLGILLSPFVIFWVVGIVAFWVSVPSVATILVLDLGAKLLQAERTGFWLGAGITAYVATLFIWLGLVGVGPLLLFTGLWLETLAIASIAVSAAILWWAFLPGGGGDDVAKAFE